MSRGSFFLLRLKLIVRMVSVTLILRKGLTMASTAYICYSSGVAAPAFQSSINAPIVISNETITSSSTAVSAPAAPAETKFAVVTLITGAGFIKVGAGAAIAIDRYLPVGVPSAVKCKEGDILSLITIV